MKARELRNSTVREMERRDGQKTKLEVVVITESMLAAEVYHKKRTRKQ